MIAAELAQALGGRRAGRGWTAKCPAHQDRTPSLSISEAADGQVLVHCFAGCPQERVIAALRDRGLWFSRNRKYDDIYRRQQSQFYQRQRELEDAGRTKRALSIWDQAQPIQKTIVETYLFSRRIKCAKAAEVLRFHPDCHRPQNAGRAPAMIGLVKRVAAGAVALHATYLRRDGTGKADEPDRATFGPVGGGAVHFGEPIAGEWLIIGEGIESTLSAAAMAEGLSAWAALSEGGIRKLVLPPHATQIVIAADNDANGVGQRAADEAAERWAREGRRVRIATPPAIGTDFNDVLCSAASG